MLDQHAKPLSKSGQLMVLRAMGVAIVLEVRLLRRLLRHF